MVEFALGLLRTTVPDGVRQDLRNCERGDGFIASQGNWIECELAEWISISVGNKLDMPKT